MKQLDDYINNTCKLLSKIDHLLTVIKSKNKVPTINSKKYDFSIRVCKDFSYSGSYKEVEIRLYQAYGYEVSFRLKDDSVNEAIKDIERHRVYLESQVAKAKKLYDVDLVNSLKQSRIHLLAEHERLNLAFRDLKSNFPHDEVYKQALGISFLDSLKIYNV